MRGISFLSRPTADIIRNIGRIHRQEIRFLIEPCGPTKFHVKQIYPLTARSGTIYTVSIGAAQLCTCGSREICIHILYVMMRYFGVPKDSELLYQRSLSDGEIDSLFERRYIQRARSHNQQDYRQSSPSRGRSQNNNHQYHQNPPPQYIPIQRPPCKKVNRLKISEDDLCPICYDSLLDCPPEEVAWCSFGCGGNFHLKCVQEWINSQNSDGKPGSCPLCRVNMDGPDTSIAPNQKEFMEYYKQQRLQRQSHQCEEAKSETAIFHSKDSSESNHQIPQRNPNNTSTNNTTNNEGSYLSMLRREMEASSASRAQIQQQIRSQESSQNNNDTNGENLAISMSELAAQITEIDEFLSAARAELDNEMNRLKEHQRRVQATIEAQIKAGARARSGLKDSRGRNVEPVLKLRVPIFDSNSANQQQVAPQRNSQQSAASILKQRQRMAADQNQQRTEVMNSATQRVDGDKESQEAPRPTRIVVSASPTPVKRIIRSEVNNSNNQLPSVQQQNTACISNSNLNATQISQLNEIEVAPSAQQKSSNLQSKQPPAIARPSVSASSSSIFTSQMPTSPPTSSLQYSSQPPTSSLQCSPPPQTSSMQHSSPPTSLQCSSSPPTSSDQCSSPPPPISLQCSSPSSSSVQHSSSPSSLHCSSSLSTLPSASPLQPPSVSFSSSLSTVPEYSISHLDHHGTNNDADKNPPEKKQSRLCSLIDEYCSLESYEEELPQPPQPTTHQSRFATPHNQSILVPHSQTRQTQSSLSGSPIKCISNQNENKKTMTMKTAKTINLNDTFNDLTAPRGNITDGLTLAHQQARENEQRMQRTLNPMLIPSGLGAKRAAKSRLQPKRAQNSQMQQQTKRKTKLGWSS